MMDQYFRHQQFRASFVDESLNYLSAALESNTVTLSYKKPGHNEIRLVTSDSYGRKDFV